MPDLRLLGPAEVRALAAELDLRPTKQRGQNFVIDGNTVRRIVRESGVTADDVVLEVGPGLGSLTLAILETGAELTAIEIDPLLAGRLPQTIKEHAPDCTERFRLVHEDALKVTEVPGPAPTALVANLPYNVSVPVLLHLMALLPSLEKGLVMVQLEVADRLAAKPGSKIYGVPSVKAAWYANVRRAGVIGRKKFIYDLWGDAVNTASRMESLGSGGAIQITAATHALIKDAFACEPRGTVEVKGKGAMEVWHVAGRKAAGFSRG